jgi:hypothetical protein
MRFLPQDISIDVIKQSQQPLQLSYLSPNIFIPIVNRVDRHIIRFIMKESFYSPFLMMKYNIFALMWEYLSDLSKTNPILAQNYLFVVDFESLFFGLNDCPSSIELRLMILMFERGYYAEMMGNALLKLNSLHYHSLEKILSRLIQYQRDKCYCRSKKCIYNAEQPLVLLPEKEKDTYRQLYQYDLIDEENKLLYPSFIINNHVDITPLDDLLNFTPTFARLAQHVIRFIEKSDIIKPLQTQQDVPELLSNAGFHYNNVFRDRLFIERDYRNTYTYSYNTAQLCYHLECIYYQYYGYIIDYASESAMKQLELFILDNQRNKSGITIKESIVLTIHQYNQSKIIKQ